MNYTIKVQVLSKNFIEKHKNLLLMKSGPTPKNSCIFIKNKSFHFDFIKHFEYTNSSRQTTIMR